MKDLFTEIWESIRRNKLRTCLTGFAVSWGLFMLIVLLGAGKGVVNAFTTQGESFASNTMQIGSGTTSKPYGGFKAGRRIGMEDMDVEFTKSKTFSDHIDAVTATVGTTVKLVNGSKYVKSAYIEGNYPSRLKMEKIDLLGGRFINQYDIDERRKVAVLPKNIAENLTEEGKALSLVGKNIKIENLSFKVVGITDSDEMRNDNLFYAPYTTVKAIYSRGKRIDDLTFTFHGLSTEKENEEFEDEYLAGINLLHSAAPDDKSAHWVWNRFTEDMQMNKAMSIITTALWIIGLFTLLGGIVGVSNIMLITVKERTHEFGIRKAIGAKPFDITKLIVTESVVITAVFGYIGMCLGMFACDIMDKSLGSRSVDVMGTEISMLVNPSVGLDVAIEATLVLIIAGTVAGLLPARKASKVKPIEALRAE